MKTHGELSDLSEITEINLMSLFDFDFDFIFIFFFIDDFI